MITARRTLVVGALVVAAILTARALTGSQPYRIAVVFTDAGQLIDGGQVQVAGRKVGTISGIDVTTDGRAKVELQIDDRSLVPLHEGTRVAIRTVGQAGIANRFVDLTPGDARAGTLANGTQLPAKQATGIVDLDQLLDSFDGPARANIRSLIKHSDQVFAGSGAADFNRMLVRVRPALSQVGALTGQLAADRRDLEDLISSSSTAARALASRRPDLQAAVTHTAQAMAAIADERAALSDTIARTPAFLTQANRTLADLDVSVTRLRPDLQALPATADAATRFLGDTTTALTTARPAVRALTHQAPGLRKVLAQLRPLSKPATAALASAQGSLHDAMPILSALRAYGPDFILGIFNGLAGVATGNYDATGHYARAEFVQSPQTLLGGAAVPLLSSRPLVPGIIDVRTKLLARCPGGSAPPAADGSSPWITKEAPCDPSDDVSAAVNRP